jgi:hypothetical protein
MTRSALLLCGLSLLLAVPLRACDIPVYRYALENWPTDSYRATVVHRGTLTAEQRSLIDQLKERSRSANVDVQVIDLDHPESDGRSERFAKRDLSAGPQLIVNYPAATTIERDIWSGPLTRKAIGAVLDSPLRREAVARLHKGETVWFLVESGTQKADDAAAKVIDQNRSTDPASVLLRVRRDDAAERMLVQMLLGSESDLAEMKKPMAFPVFGRGRVLYALVGAGINTDTVRRVGTFIGGDCSCTVKHSNPGTDLLLVADWSDVRIGDAPTAAAAVETVGPMAEPVEAAPPPPPANSNGSRGALWVAVVFAGGLVLLTGTLALRSLKSRPRNS